MRELKIFSGRANQKPLRGGSPGARGHPAPSVEPESVEIAGVARGIGRVQPRMYEHGIAPPRPACGFVPGRMRRRRTRVLEKHRREETRRMWPRFETDGLYANPHPNPRGDRCRPKDPAQEPT